MTEIDEFFRPSHDDLIYELEAHGFVEVKSGSWAGGLTACGRVWNVRLEFDWPYPAHPPKIFLQDEKPLSWHQNFDGSLCLYSQTAPGAFPWFAHGALLDHIRNWLEKDATGWAGDFPDLDLERYWAPNRRFTLLVHDELPDEGNHWVRLERTRPSTLAQKRFSPPPPRKRPKSHKAQYGLSSDMGEISTPPRSWADLSAVLKDPATVEEEVRAHRADVLLLRYWRDGNRGVLGLVPVRGGANQTLQFSSVNCASRSPQTMALRAGFQSTELREKIVTVVGVGAVGSFIADGLARSGVARLILVDSDRLRPGNLVRHAASAAFVGDSKSEAMAATLGKTALSLPSAVNSIADAKYLVDSSDLVIDATANEVVTQLLAEAGRKSGKLILSVYLANQGRSKVVETLPCERDSRLVPTAMVATSPEGIESGCGDPVSPTPPFAVMEVAAMACRVATKILTDDTMNAFSELREQR